MSKRFQLTPEQIALSEERKAKKQKMQTQALPNNGDASKASILIRPWLDLDSAKLGDGIRVKLLTWNLLAQCLVRK
jgi:RNA exonuclease NGL2